MPYKPGDIISHPRMSMYEGFSPQQGMNYHIGRGDVSVLLMSVRKNSPYQDEVRDDGRTIIYEGHDARKDNVEGSVKNYDQPLYLPSGKPTANGKFYEAAKSKQKEIVRIYEKIKDGIWVYNGIFTLDDAYVESDGRRNVVKFVLRVLSKQDGVGDFNARLSTNPQQQTRMIPSHVKFKVYKRDKGACVICGSKQNLHYDHDLPYSKGGTSLLAQNIRLLCATHNLRKSNKIE